MQPVVTIAVISLEFFSLMAALYIAYFIWLRTIGEGTEQKPLAIDWKFAAWSALFVCAAAASLYHGHELAEDGKILETAISLTLGFAAAAVIYVIFLRKRWEDNRIQYAMLLWATLWVFIAFFIFIAWRWRDLKIDDNALQIINNAAQILGIVIAAAMIVLTNLINARQQNATAQHKIYQTLELQSVQLFQWEIDHPQYVDAFWYKKNLPPDGIKRYLLKQYVCQMLNLFEMAVRFRRQGIVAPEVFGSWVIWMWEVCNAKVFHKLCASEDALLSNYVSEFRQVMSKGVFISKGKGSEERKRKGFFLFIGEYLNCEKVLQWYDDAPDTHRLAKP